MVAMSSKILQTSQPIFKSGAVSADHIFRCTLMHINLHDLQTVSFTTNPVSGSHSMKGCPCSNTTLCTTTCTIQHNHSTSAELVQLCSSTCHLRHMVHHMRHDHLAIDNSATVGVQCLSADVRGILRCQEHIAGGHLTGLAWAAHLRATLEALDVLLRQQQGGAAGVNCGNQEMLKHCRGQGGT